ncbi:unnamed protein product [Closterium sp. NIES-53]
MARINESTNQRIELDDRVSISADFPAGSAISPATQARRRFIEDKGAGDNVAAERAEMLARVLAPSGDYLPRIKLGAAGGAEEASAGWLGAEGATRANTTQPIRRAQRRTVTPSSSSSSSSPLSVASATTFVAACVVAAGAAFARHKSLPTPPAASVSGPACRSKLTFPACFGHKPHLHPSLVSALPSLNLCLALSVFSRPLLHRFDCTLHSPDFSPSPSLLHLFLLPLATWLSPSSFPPCSDGGTRQSASQGPGLSAARACPRSRHTPHTLLMHPTRFTNPSHSYTRFRLSLLHCAFPTSLPSLALSPLRLSQPSSSLAPLFLTLTPLPHSHPSSALTPLSLSPFSLTRSPRGNSSCPSRRICQAIIRWSRRLKRWIFLRPSHCAIRPVVSLVPQVLGHYAVEEAPHNDLRPVMGDGSVQLRTAAARSFLSMQDAARRDGIFLTPLSG